MNEEVEKFYREYWDYGMRMYDCAYMMGKWFVLRIHSDFHYPEGLTTA
jgi:hypothetical protein